MVHLPRLLLIGVCLLPQSLALAATREALTVMLNGRAAGTLVATLNDRRVDIDWRVDDNGRGSKIREQLILDERGVPVDYRIEGRAWYGAPVRETFAWRNGVARYRSLSDSGELRTASPPYYVAAEGSPWPIAQAMRMALAAPDQTIQVAPSGTLHVAKLRELTVGSGSNAVAVTAYSLTGLGLQPEFALLDADLKLFALVSVGYVTVREGYEGELDRLTKLALELDRETLSQLTKDQRHHYDAPIYLRNVRVFDSVSRKLSAPTTVGVFRGSITSLDAAVPEAGAAVVIEGEGHTLVPGLFDMHTHYDAWQGPLNLAAGVTTVRDLGNDNESLLALERQLASGQLMGPRIVRAGFIEGSGPFSASNGTLVENQEQALAAARWYADHGYVQIKIYNSMRPEWVKPLAAEAHRLGLRVSGHVPAFMSSAQAIRDGYDEINHINQLLIYLVLGEKEDTRTLLRFTAIGERLDKLDLDGPAVTQLLQLLKEHGTTIDVTLAIFQQMLQTRAGETPPNDAHWLDHAPASVQRSRRAPVLDIKPAQLATYEASMRKLLAFTRRLDDEGIRIVAGTDDIAGFMLHSELESYVLAGIPADRVLQIATIDAARYLGLDQQLGSIEHGKRADFLLVEGDPTKDITALRRTRLVMQAEDIWLPPELHRAIGVKPFTTAPVITVRQ
jgi:hypothetical protein